MKLFLSSEGVPHPDVLRELIGATGPIRVALINNAQDPYPYLLAKASEAGLAVLFRSLGFEPVPVDLRAYEGKTEALVQELRTCQLIWCAGGNSFWLRYVMHTSGFDTALPSLLAEGVVYGGWSAGAVVVGPSLHPIELMDDPSKAPEVIGEGLGIVDCFVWPHWDKEKYKHLQEAASKQMALLPYESVILRDGEVLVVDNGEKRIVR